MFAATMPPTTMLPIAMTLGDPRGIGPETVARVLCSPEGVGVVAVGPKLALAQALQLVAPDWRVAQLQNFQEARAFLTQPAHRHVPLIDPGLTWGAGKKLLKSEQQTLISCWQTANLLPKNEWAEIEPIAGAAAAGAVMAAAQAALRGDVAAIVTAPLNKAALAAAGFEFAGHTELLQWQAAQHGATPLPPVRMMLANPELRTILVSIHVSLRAAVEAVTHFSVMQTLQIAHAALLPILGHAPRLGVAGLNPHAGEGGLLGREEIEHIAPAIAQAQAMGINASGPFAPDTVFMRARHAPGHPGEFDAVIAMYHDQGLIPVKYLGVDHGVNVTLGLPLVRTSPDHGTAFDIAWTGQAKPHSLERALSMARELVQQRH